jgi:phospholipase A-2-activating protein
MDVDWEIASSVSAGDGCGVRCACELPPISGEEDFRLVVGTQSGALYQWSFPSLSIMLIDYQHDDSVSSILSNENIYITGCKDSVIRVFDASTHCFMLMLKGHEKPVTCLAFSSSLLVSGSWDGTAKVWNVTNGSLVASLPDHENSVCVASIESQDNDTIIVASGSAGTAQGNVISDHAVRLWKINVETGNFQLLGKVSNDHNGPIRDITLSRESGLLATCSNDGTVKIRDTSTGKCIETLVFPAISEPPMFLSIISSSTGFVVGAEDGHVVAWKSDTTQLIRHPSSVWQVLSLSNNDFLTCCQDGAVRIFTQASDRVASEEEKNRFSEEVHAAATRTGPTQDEIEKLPKWEKNASVQGKKEGQVHLFQKDGIPIAAQWDAVAKTWIEVGQVVSNANSKTEGGMIDGVKYDYVLPIEIDRPEGTVATLQIGYNTGENPFVASQRFIDSHMLPQYHLSEIADYIQKSVGSSGSKDAKSKALIQPILHHLPASGYKTFEIGKNTSFEKILHKIEEVGKLFDEEKTVLRELVDTLSQTSRYHVSEIKQAAFQILLKILSWPPDQAFPAIDLARLVVLHPGSPSDDNLPRVIEACFKLCEKDTTGVAVPMLTLRLIANCFSGHTNVLDLNQVTMLTEKYIMSSNKNIRLSVATVLLNISSYLHSTQNANDVSEQVVRQVNKVLDSKLYDAESITRILMALGTILLARTHKAKDTANSLFMATKVEMMASPHGLKAQEIAKEIYKLLQE